jgi:hypothetical protein
LITPSQLIGSPFLRHYSRSWRTHPSHILVATGALASIGATGGLFAAVGHQLKDIHDSARDFCEAVKRDQQKQKEQREREFREKDKWGYFEGDKDDKDDVRLV